MPWKKDKTSDGTEEKKRKNVIKNIGGFCKLHKKLLIFLCFLLILVSVGSMIFLKRGGKKQVIEEAAYTTESLTKRTVTNSLSITGTIASADSKTVTSAMKDVEVISVNVAVGDTVKAGDVICVLDSKDLQDELENAKTNLNVTNQKTSNEIDKALTELENTKTSVNISNSRAADSLTEAAGKYSEAESTYSNAQTAYEKAKEKRNTLKDEVTELKSQIEENKEELSDLNKSFVEAEEADKPSVESKITDMNNKIISLQSQYEKKKTSYEAAKQAVEEKKKNYEEAENTLDSAKSSYKKALQEQEDTNRNGTQSIADKEDNLDGTKLNSITSGSSEEEQVNSIQNQIDQCTVTAPIDGIITSVGVKAGETFASGNVAIVQNDKEFIVEAEVDEYDIPDIQKGQHVVVKTDATDEEELDGEVIFVAPTPETVDSSSGSSSMGSSSSSDASYKVQIKLNNKNDRLRIGMTAKTSIILEESADVYAVPYDAISTNANGESIIYIIGGEAGVNSVSGNSSESMPQPPSGEMMKMDTKQSRNSQPAVNKKEIIVTVGLESDYYTEISSDELTEGMQVITGMQSQSTGNANDSQNSTFMFGGMGGGMNGGGGNPGSGGPSGGRP